mgnify:CR=1 FL=1
MTEDDCPDFPEPAAPAPKPESREFVNPPASAMHGTQTLGAWLLTQPFHEVACVDLSQIEKDWRPLSYNADATARSVFEQHCRTGTPALLKHFDSAWARYLVTLSITPHNVWLWLKAQPEGASLTIYLERPEGVYIPSPKVIFNRSRSEVDEYCAQLSENGCAIDRDAFRLLITLQPAATRKKV